MVKTEKTTIILLAPASITRRKLEKLFYSPQAFVENIGGQDMKALPLEKVNLISSRSILMLWFFTRKLVKTQHYSSNHFHNGINLIVLPSCFSTAS